MDHHREKFSAAPPGPPRFPTAPSAPPQFTAAAAAPHRLAATGSSSGKSAHGHGPVYTHPAGDPEHEQDNSFFRSTTNPADLYTLDELLAEEDMLDSFAEEIVVELKGTLESLEARSLSRSGPRIYINRPRAEAHQQLVRDYFSENPLYPAKIFRRRFRMRRPLFLCIVNALGEWSPYFTTRKDALNREGLSPLQKCTAAIRQLAYGTPADSLAESILYSASSCTFV